MRFLTAIVLLLAAPGVMLELWRSGWALSAVPHFPYLAGGLAAGLLLEVLFLRRFWPTFEIFEHELTHALFALLCLRLVTGFVVRRSGGEVRYRGRFGGKAADDLIGLAPYVAPTFTLIGALLRPVFPPAWFPWCDFALGATLGYHVGSALRETRVAWTKRSFASAGSGEATRSDVGKRGYVFSFVFIVVVGAALHGLLFDLLAAGPRGALAWASHVWTDGQPPLRAAWACVAEFSGRLF